MDKSNKPDPMSAAVAAHLRRELAAPARAIRGYTGILLQDADPELETVEDFAALDQAAQELEQMFNSLADGDQPRPYSARALRHDLRNVAGAVVGYAEMLLDDAQTGAVTRDLQALLHESKQLLFSLDTLVSPGAGETSPAATSDTPSLDGLRTRFELQQDPGVVLVIDDNSSSRTLLARLLERDGHQVLHADTGLGGLAVLAEQNVDLILLDLLLPDLNGYQVLQKIKQDETTAHLPVIMISGLDEQAGVVNCIQAGAEDYLTKPVDPVLLRARLEASLDRLRLRLRERQHLNELEQNQRFIRLVFGRYLSDDIVRELLDNPDGLDLGGGRRHVSVLMADLRGFTTLAHALPPEQVVSLLNNYLGPMTEIIMGHGGTVDEFIGDAILAIFGAPNRLEDHADRALACAIEMQQAITAVNATNLAQGLPAVAAGIGVNSGEVIVGNIGSDKRTKYGVVGHPVNLTARVQGFTLGGQILCSEETVAATQATLLLDDGVEIEPKGMSDRITIYPVQGIGAPYNLTLETNSSPDLRPLEPPVTAVCQRLLGSTCESDEYPVQLLAYHGESALLRSSTPLEPMTKLRISIKTEDGEASDGYCLIGQPQPSTTDIWRVNFTSLSDTLRQRLSNPA
ncbi:MAG: response regulator [Gammaproteobacteria bacterium]|nr:response regulator [Gammaproteobacteria bacterium]